MTYTDALALLGLLVLAGMAVVAVAALAAGLALLVGWLLVLGVRALVDRSKWNGPAVVELVDQADDVVDELTPLEQARRAATMSRHPSAVGPRLELERLAALPAEELEDLIDTAVLELAESRRVCSAGAGSCDGDPACPVACPLELGDATVLLPRADARPPVPRRPVITNSDATEAGTCG